MTHMQRIQILEGGHKVLKLFKDYDHILVNHMNSVSLHLYLKNQIGTFSISDDGTLGKAEEGVQKDIRGGVIIYKQAILSQDNSKEKLQAKKPNLT
jgi:hypothetical protein